MASATFKPTESPSTHRSGDARRPPSRPGRGWRLASADLLRNLRVRTKLVAIVAVPVLTIMVVATTAIAADVAGVQRADRERRIVPLVAGVATAVHEMQGEAILATHDTGVASVNAQRARTDDAVDAFRRFANDGVVKRFPADLGEQLDAVEEPLAELAAQRRALDDKSSDVVKVSKYYDDLTHQLIAITDRIAGLTQSQEPVRNMRTLASVSHTKATVTERLVLLGGGVRRTEEPRVRSLFGTQFDWMRTFEATATNAQRNSRVALAAMPKLTIPALRSLQKTALRSDAVGRQVLVTTIQNMRTLEQALTGDLRQSIQQVSSSLVRQLAITAAALLLIVLLATLVTLRVARSIAGQLVTMRNTATLVASHRLPELVERLQQGGKIDQAMERARTAADAPRRSDTATEVREVSVAFQTAADKAVEVATEQAELRKSIEVMLLNLARRSEVVIDRQLELIERLEFEEEDPDALGRLFAFDHLATRLRRNTENLIVLSGARPPRRWKQPVPLSDIARGAIGEVEDYSRVELLPVDPVSVTGQAVSDVVHLLAELIENAVNYSAPGTKVHVAGQPVPAGYLVEIEDQGIGLREVELAEINRRLAEPPAVDLAVSRRVGLFVVSRLAQRYGIKVELRESWYGGVVALVVLPEEILVREVEQLPGAPVSSTRNGLPASLPPVPQGRGQTSGEQGPQEVGGVYVPLRRHASMRSVEEIAASPPSPEGMDPELPPDPFTHG